jgi:hypothetical protein
MKDLTSLLVATLEDEPTRRLGHVEDTGKEEDGGGELDADGSLPGDAGGALVEGIDAGSSDNNTDNLNRF